MCVCVQDHLLRRPPSAPPSRASTLQRDSSRESAGPGSSYPPTPPLPPYPPSHPAHADVSLAIHKTFHCYSLFKVSGVNVLKFNNAKWSFCNVVSSISCALSLFQTHALPIALLTFQEFNGPSSRHTASGSVWTFRSIFDFSHHSHRKYKWNAFITRPVCVCVCVSFFLFFCTLQTKASSDTPANRCRGVGSPRGLYKNTLVTFTLVAMVSVVYAVCSAERQVNIVIIIPALVKLSKYQRTLSFYMKWADVVRLIVELAQTNVLPVLVYYRT